MHRVIRLTTLEFWNLLSFRVLLASTLVMPVLAAVFASLFMLDLGKVYIDGIFTFSHLLAVIFLLLLAVPFLAQDLKNRFYFMLVGQSISRPQYILSRFIGISLMFLLLMLCLAISSTLIASLITHLWEGYAEDFVPTFIISGVMLYAIEYISMIAIAMLFFSWASGENELLVMVFLVWVIAWVIPPVLAATQNPEVSQTMPGWLLFAISSVYQLLPHLNGHQISLMISHGDAVAISQALFFILEHVSYAILALIVSVLLFSRQDL